MILPCLLSASIALALGASAPAASPATPQGLVTAATADDQHALGLRAFAAKAGEPLVPVLVELAGAQAFTAKSANLALSGAAKRDAAIAHHRRAVGAQDQLLARLAKAGFPILPRSAEVQVAPGVKHRVDYRFSYLLNGFVAFVPESRLPELRERSDVRSVTRIAPTRLFLDHSVNYLLGSQPAVADRRDAVYGATEELGPSGSNGNGPALGPVDGYEGQGIILGVIDSGMDYEHPMLGGAGAGTPLPQRPPLTTTSANQKVLYWYNLGGATTLDDHGHGTHVSSTAAGYLVDGATPVITPTGSAPFGPPPGDVAMHGVAPQARMMGWPVCNAAGNCAGDIELAIEDAVSPVVLTGAGDGNAIETGIAKPVADVINLSLGGGNDPAGPSARVANSATLAGGAVIVAAAGNDGPGEATVGAPCVATLAICVASVQDPGSTAGSDVLASGQVAGEACADSNTGVCASAAPAAETGAASEANTVAPGEQAGLRTYTMAGGGDLPDGSVSAHYVYVDRDQATVPPHVTGRIALLEGGTGTFAQIVNPVAALSPAAIILITDTSSATAVAVVNGVPTYTMAVADGAYLKQALLSSAAAPVHGAVSQLPLRVKSSIALEVFTGAISDFSSRGPNAAPNAQYRTIKPDVAGLGQGILAATTPTGNPDGALGMASASGYATANGTSMASPHVAGAAALVRQRVRALGYDSTDDSDPDYRAKRFRAATIVRALLTNTATDLRTGTGGEDPDAPNPPYTIQDVGAGLVDVDAALDAHAIMTSPSVLYEAVPDEFTAPDGLLPVPLDPNGDALVPLPTASFGSVPVIGSVNPVVLQRPVTIEDIDGDAGGSWNLSTVDDVLSDHPDIDIRFFNQTGDTEITSVNVPSNGSATFLVRVTIDGDGTLPTGAIASWYVHADNPGHFQRLRMPMMVHLASFDAPNLGLPGPVSIGAAGAPNGEGCPVDLDNAFTVDWSYSAGGGSIDPFGWRLQRGTFEAELFADDASEPLAGGANSTWSGSPQWTSGVNPDTSSEAYFVPNAAEQAEALTLLGAIPLPEGALGATLEVTTRIDTEEGFDFASIQASADGGAFATLGRFSGVVSGTLNFDLVAFVGSDLLLQFLMNSDLAVVAPGWWVDEVRVTSNDFALLTELATATPTSSAQSVAAPGTFRFRVAGLYSLDPETDIVGPYTSSACVCVPSSAFATAGPDVVFGSGFEAGELAWVSCD